MLRELAAESKAGFVPVDELRPGDHNASNPSTSSPLLAGKPGDSTPRLVVVPKPGVGQDGEFKLMFYNGKRLEEV